MAGKFEVKVGKDGKHRFNLKASNGQVILSSQGYAQRTGCLNGIESVRKHGVQGARFESKLSDDGKSYFVLKAGNGQVIGTSQRYASAASCDAGIKSVMANAAKAKLVEE